MEAQHQKKFQWLSHTDECDCWSVVLLPGKPCQQVAKESFILPKIHVYKLKYILHNFSKRPLDTNAHSTHNPVKLFLLRSQVLTKVMGQDAFWLNCTQGCHWWHRVLHCMGLLKRRSISCRPLTNNMKASCHLPSSGTNMGNQSIGHTHTHIYTHTTHTYTHTYTHAYTQENARAHTHTHTHTHHYYA